MSKVHTTRVQMRPSGAFKGRRKTSSYLELEVLKTSATAAFSGSRSKAPGSAGGYLLDLALPDINGAEATRRIKADPATSRIPVIALTASAMPGDREKALAAGCDDFDTKPVELQRLLGKITALKPQ
jgi:CheY-like chemotaxis protein